MTTPNNRRPITPGEVLREDFIEPLNLTQGQLADALDVDRTSINELINGRRCLTPEMAVRLGHALSTTPEYWLKLQTAVDLYDAVHSPIASEVQRLQVLVPA